MRDKLIVVHRQSAPRSYHLGFSDGNHTLKTGPRCPPGVFQRHRFSWDPSLSPALCPHVCRIVQPAAVQTEGLLSRYITDRVALIPHLTRSTQPRPPRGARIDLLLGALCFNTTLFPHLAYTHFIPYIVRLLSRVNPVFQCYKI